MKIMIGDYECAFITLYSEMRRITPILQAIDRGEHYFKEKQGRVKYSRKRKIILPVRVANWECDCGMKGRGSAEVKSAIRSLKRHSYVFHPEWANERGFIIEYKGDEANG